MNGLEPVCGGGLVKTRKWTNWVNFSSFTQTASNLACKVQESGYSNHRLMFFLVNAVNFFASRQYNTSGRKPQTRPHRRLSRRFRYFDSTTSYATRQSQTLDLERLPRTRRAAGRRQAAYQLRDRQARRRQRFATEPLETRSRVRFTRRRARRHVPRPHHHHRPSPERESHCRQESARRGVAAGHSSEGGS